MDNITKSLAPGVTANSPITQVKQNNGNIMDKVFNNCLNKVGKYTYLNNSDCFL